MNQDSFLNLPYSQNPRSQVGAAAGFQNQNFLNKMDYKKNDYNNNSMYNIQMMTNQASDFGFGGASGNGAHNPNNNNPRKLSNLWECNICHKVFKERKGFYQHINSNTHEPIKYSCSQCGKGFASLGALALHNEQASHAHLPNRGIGGTASTGDSTASGTSKAPSTFPPAKNDSPLVQGFPSDNNNNFYPMGNNANGNINQFPTAPPQDQQFSARGTPFQAPSAASLASNMNNVNVFGMKNNNQGYPPAAPSSTESYYNGSCSRNNDFQGGGGGGGMKLPLQPSSNYSLNLPPQQQSQQQQPFKTAVKPFMNTYLSSTQESIEELDNRYFMYFIGLIDLGSLLGAFSWCIGDEANGVMVTQGAVTVVDTFLSTEQLEYKGLINGLKAALSKGLKAVTIRSNSEIVISHVMGEQKSKYLETVYHSLDELKAEALSLFPLFELIKFELVPIERIKYVYQIAKKNITETVSAGGGNGMNNNIINTNNTVPPLQLQVQHQHSTNTTFSSSPLSPPMPQFNTHNNNNNNNHHAGIPSFLKGALGNSSDSISINVGNGTTTSSLVSTPCHSNPNSFPSRYSISSATTVVTNSSNNILSGNGRNGNSGTGGSDTGNNTNRSNFGSVISGLNNNNDYSSNHNNNSNFSQPPGLHNNNNNMLLMNNNNNNNMMNNIADNMLLSSSQHSDYNNNN